MGLAAAYPDKVSSILEFGEDIRDACLFVSEPRTAMISGVINTF